jgi:HNH endonuclease
VTLSEFILAWRDLASSVKGKCFYCGKQTQRGGLRESNSIFQTRDHVVPRSTKPQPLHNCVICCRKCNNKKRDLTMQEFKRVVKIETFYAEEILGVRINDLSDIAEVTFNILNTRKPDQRSIKLHGRTAPKEPLPQPTNK